MNEKEWAYRIAKETSEKQTGGFGKYKHLMYMPFSGLGLYNGFRGNRWLKNRIKICKLRIRPFVAFSMRCCDSQMGSREEQPYGSVPCPYYRPVNVNNILQESEIFSILLDILRELCRLKLTYLSCGCVRNCGSSSQFLY